MTSIVFASDLAEEDDWSISTDDTRDNGIQAFSITVYSGATIAGHYRLSVIHNANNEVGVWTWYEGEAGATGFTIYAELRVSFEATDAPEQAAAGGASVETILDWTNVGTATSSITTLTVDQNNSMRADDVENIVFLLRGSRGQTSTSIKGDKYYGNHNGFLNVVLPHPGGSGTTFVQMSNSARTVIKHGTSAAAFQLKIAVEK